MVSIVLNKTSFSCKLQFAIEELLENLFDDHASSEVVTLPELFNTVVFLCDGDALAIFNKTLELCRVWRVVVARKGEVKNSRKEPAEPAELKWRWGLPPLIPPSASPEFGSVLDGATNDSDSDGIGISFSYKNNTV